MRNQTSLLAAAPYRDIGTAQRQPFSSWQAMSPLARTASCIRSVRDKKVEGVRASQQAMYKLDELVKTVRNPLDADIDLEHEFVKKSMMSGDDIHSDEENGSS